MSLFQAFQGRKHILRILKLEFILSSMNFLYEYWNSSEIFRVMLWMLCIHYSLPNNLAKAKKRTLWIMSRNYSFEIICEPCQYIFILFCCFLLIKITIKIFNPLIHKRQAFFHCKFESEVEIIFPNSITQANWWLIQLLKPFWSSK